MKTEGDIPLLDAPIESWNTQNNSPRNTGKFKDYLLKIERNKIVFSNMNSKEKV